MLIGMVASACAQTGMITFFTVICYFVEDWTPAGSGAQQLIGVSLMSGQLATIAVARHVGGLIDRVGTLRMAIGILGFNAVALLLVLVARQPSYVGVNIAAQMISQQLLFMAAIPLYFSFPPYAHAKVWGVSGEGVVELVLS